MNISFIVDAGAKKLDCQLFRDLLKNEKETAVYNGSRRCLYFKELVLKIKDRFIIVFC